MDVTIKRRTQLGVRQLVSVVFIFCSDLLETVLRLLVLAEGNALFFIQSHHALAFRLGLFVLSLGGLKLQGIIPRIHLANHLALAHEVALFFEVSEYRARHPKSDVDVLRGLDFARIRNNDFLRGSAHGVGLHRYRKLRLLLFRAARHQQEADRCRQNKFSHNYILSFYSCKIKKNL